MLLSRLTDTVLCFSVLLLRIGNDSVLISWNDVVEYTVSFQQMKCSADTLLKKFSSWLSLFVGDCDTTAFGLVGTTAFGLIQQKRSFDKSADALLGVYQQMYFEDS
ncbi:hypothetical protein F511_21621 [Dorcoceras hygrometricum]|uniref:Uncharacterized protein n=1 Tax=Dorcoceras hygrometricum TaxID=472368 RepID=A0A2Z7D299_9LAMI|nr:hypothetical protein F511_21621 [Dorcoceras hygrometricum]